jgi:hypothetical protein
MNIYLDTKDQLVRLLREWGVSEPIPGKGKKLIVCFPPPAVLNVATIIKSDKKSTYGKALWEIKMEARG